MNGLSPRLRGNHKAIAKSAPRKRSIPAPAGEPQPWLERPYHGKVYPRACGGTPVAMLSEWSTPGLSPRLRGNLVDVPLSLLYRRSIPAPAGEPRQGRFPLHQRPVYPRACGGTRRTHDLWGPHHGLSPRLRGTVRDVPLNILACGLSPRLRGNRVIDLLGPNLAGSIPAPAGEPIIIVFMRIVLGVYPRACGEPRRCLARLGKGWVYPRACGGTAPRPWIAPVSCGLSPRLRGTLGTTMLTAITGGLSPRLRGNHTICMKGDIDTGSIPAPAGEPSRPRSGVQSVRVYPRACGGTGIG